MTVCILTVIKNEHPYLDEWIQYHLNLGISRIFILEDIDSASHQAITQQYGSKVFLAPGLSILTENDRNLILTNRAQNKPGGQKTYIKAGLTYIQNHFDYDWCFVIDNDEFLTFQEGYTLDSILNTFSSYDAFIMSWECYGASGRVSKPDYTKHTVIDSFAEPIKGYVPTTSVEHNKKTCYNLHTFRREFWQTIHVPTDACNFCNTDYRKDKLSTCLNGIYIRHYISKSWEEYRWKKLERGYFYGIVRTFDAFFNMNPDLLPLKKALLASETLVVLPYSSRGSQGHELSFALNGWRKFCQFNYRFVIIGDVDKRIKQEFPWVEFIDVPPAPRIADQYYPHIDIQHKMKQAYELFHIRYDGFIWMVDDNYAIRPFSQFDILQTHYLNTSFTGVESMATSFWKHDKWKTRQLLDQEDLPHMNYTTHFPCYFRFDWLKDIWDKYNMRENSCVVEDIYFNSHRVAQPLPVNDIRYGIWGPKQMGEPLEAALANSNIKFLCNSVEGWSVELERILSHLILEST